MQRAEDDLEKAMKHIRQLQDRRRRLASGGNGDPKRHALLAQIEAELQRLEPVKRAYIRWRFFGAGRLGGQPAGA